MRLCAATRRALLQDGPACVAALRGASLRTPHLTSPLPGQRQPPPLRAPRPARLSRRSAEPLCRDLSALTRRRAPAALVDLELQRCVWSAEAGACVAALTALTRLRLERPECVRPARASGAASRAAMSVDLQPLVALRGMRCFELVAATGSVAGVVQVGSERGADGTGAMWGAEHPPAAAALVVGRANASVASAV